MADKDVKSPASLGANESQTRRGEPPSPSPSAASSSPLRDVPTRINHVQPQPVKSSAYQAIAELNRGFEQVTQNFQTLQQFNFFPADNLTAWINTICLLQAETNLRLMDALNSREMDNALYFDRLCLQWERQLRDSDDVLFEAEHRKQELAEEQKRKEAEVTSTEYAATHYPQRPGTKVLWAFFICPSQREAVPITEETLLSKQHPFKYD
jgi:hypothetical protein